MGTISCLPKAVVISALLAVMHVAVDTGSDVPSMVHSFLRDGDHYSLVITTTLPDVKQNRTICFFLAGVKLSCGPTHEDTELLSVRLDGYDNMDFTESVTYLLNSRLLIKKRITINDYDTNIATFGGLTLSALITNFAGLNYNAYMILPDVIDPLLVAEEEPDGEGVVKEAHPDAIDPLLVAEEEPDGEGIVKEIYPEADEKTRTIPIKERPDLNRHPGTRTPECKSSVIHNTNKQSSHKHDWVFAIALVGVLFIGIAVGYLLSWMRRPVHRRRLPEIIGMYFPNFYRGEQPLSAEHPLTECTENDESRVHLCVRKS